MSDYNLSVSEKLLLAMHNLCLVRLETAKTGQEIARLINLTTDNVEKILKGHEANGYVKSVQDASGERKFYLTNIGILKVCSTFT